MIERQNTCNAPAAPRLLPDVMHELINRKPPYGRVLSVYLDTSSARRTGQGHRLALLEGCRALRTAVSPDDEHLFEAAVGHVKQFLAEHLPSGVIGIAMFASGDPDYFYAVPLPAPPEDLVAWEDRPYIAPLAVALDELERVALAMVDQERARLFTIFLGAIETRREFADDVPGKYRTGGWYALAQTRYAHHHDEHVRRHLNRVTHELLALHRSRPFDRLFLAGPPETLATLQERLPRPLRQHLAGMLHLELFATEPKILAEVLHAAETAEQRADMAAVEELLEAQGGRQAVIDLAATLSAVNQHRVRQLVLGADFAHTRGRCPDCDALTQSKERCPVCDAAIEPLADLRDTVLAAGLAQGATVNIVAGPSAAKLAAVGGIGAWLQA
ncbi:MAG: host attachment protein [Dehalococcoidia bacterium]